MLCRSPALRGDDSGALRMPEDPFEMQPILSVGCCMQPLPPLEWDVFSLKGVIIGIYRVSYSWRAPEAIITSLILLASFWREGSELGSPAPAPSPCLSAPLPPCSTDHTAVMRWGRGDIGGYKAYLAVHIQSWVDMRLPPGDSRSTHLYPHFLCTTWLLNGEITSILLKKSHQASSLFS